MSKDEWRRRRRSPWWFDVFEEFDRIERMMDRMIRQAFSEAGRPKPFIYGFSVSIGPDGTPVIREFGNVQPSQRGLEVREHREPLVDVLEEDDEVVVVAEVPGASEEDIHVHATEETLTIRSDAPRGGFYRRLSLPARVNPSSVKTSYKNGVLEVRLAKLGKTLLK